MLNGRIYRAAALPLLVAVAVGALSLSNRPAPLTSEAAPEAFDGAWTMAELRTLSQEYPRRLPASKADVDLAHRVAQTIEGLGRDGAGGFHVSLRRVQGQTIEGERSLLTVIAARPGTTSGSAIVVIAHRDAAGRGAQAELSGTAVLLELARALANRQTNRTIVLVSTSGGSGGDAGASDFARLVQGGHVPWPSGSGSTPATAGPSAGAGGGPEGATSTGSGGVSEASTRPESAGGAEGGTGAEAPRGGEAGPGAEAATAAANASGASGSVDAALVLGDLGSEDLSRPLVVPYSSGLGSAPVQLAETATQAIGQQAGIRPGSPSLVDQLVHLAAPLTSGEQGPLDALGVPAVLIQASGERPPTRSAALSSSHLETLGGAVLGTLEALDAGPDIAGHPAGELVFSQKVLPGWAMRLIVAALLLPAVLVVIDALARVRRRGEPVWRWLAFTLACGLPVLACALIVAIMGALGLAGPIPGPAAPAGVGQVNVPAVATAALAIMVLVLGCVYWPRVVAFLGVAERPHPPAAGVALLTVLDVVAVLTWVRDPFAALVMVPGVHLWMLLAAPELRPRPRLVRLGVALLGVCAPLLVAVYYAQHLATGVLGFLWAGLLLIAGGQIGIGTLALWSLWLGCVVVVVMLARYGRTAERVSRRPRMIPVRGSLRYAPPGPLAGTESALRSLSGGAQDA